MKRKLSIAAVLLLAVSVTYRVFAGAVEEHYAQIPDANVTAVVVASADSADWTTATRGKATNGNPNIVVSVRTDQDAEQVCVSVGLYKEDGTFLGIAGVTTVTTTGQVDAAGLYVSPITFFDSAGARTYDVRLGSAATLYRWTAGAFHEQQ